VIEKIYQAAITVSPCYERYRRPIGTDFLTEKSDREKIGSKEFA
jgi:hypothetical protein